MNTIKHRKKANGGGRPRTFDENVALEQAMRVFWRKGYEGTSLADLTTEMGINPPSLYRTFGNKEKLFWKAIDRYGEGPAAYVAECLNEPTAFAVVAKRLRLRGRRDERSCASVGLPRHSGGGDVRRPGQAGAKKTHCDSRRHTGGTL